MSDLVEFLRARLDDDERVARAAAEGPWRAAAHADGYSICLYGPDRLQDGGADPEHSGRRREVMRPWVVAGPGYEYGGFGRMEDAEHAARHDPARALRQVAAWRRIVARHRRTGPDHWEPGACEGCGWTGDLDQPRTDKDEVCPELADLASVYANHPDYRTEWRPEGTAA